MKLNIDSLGKDLALLRVEKMISQAEMSKHLSINSLQLIKIESGGNICLKDLIKYVDKLGYKLQIKLI